MNRQENSSHVLLPGSTIGILGSGQLGRMMAVAAKQMGYRIHVFSTSHESPAGQVADLNVQASFTDLDAVEAFARQVDVITIETENVPTECLGVAARFAPSFPGQKALEVSQNRAREKQFLAENGIPTAKFRVVRSLDELHEASQQIMPGVLKTTTGGYDGKGQSRIQSSDDLEAAWNALNTDAAILEEWIEYDFEFSIVAARNSAGLLTAYPSIRNEHRNAILDVSICPSGLSNEVNQKAVQLTYRVLEELSAVGVLTVEFFYRDGEILVNEMAPRPHNSGHLTIEGHITSQFEQHIRAVCGLTFGSTQQFKPVAMANLLGNEWSNGEPQWDQALSLPNTKLHLYGKGTPDPNRKMGHMTTLAKDSEQAQAQVLAARKLLNLKLTAEIARHQIANDDQNTLQAPT